MTDAEFFDACKKVLKRELVPAMGCTEPIAIAYASALARDALGEEVVSAEAVLSRNIIKNVKSVIVPHTGGLKGIAAAIAVGVVAGVAEKKLEAISDVTQEQIHEDIKKYVFDAIIPENMVDSETKFFINPTGRFVIGGPHGDSGLTGRKIIVDTYGGKARHGGGAFSGKDCTKVDRSAAYAARYAAKNIVAAGLAKRCEIQLSYAIGVAQPTSVSVDTFGTGKVSDSRLVEIIRENFDLRPAGIIKMLDLRRPIYKQTAAYGHFGRNDLDLPWEKLDKVETLKKYL